MYTLIDSNNLSSNLVVISGISIVGKQNDNLSYRCYLYFFNGSLTVG